MNEMDDTKNLVRLWRHGRAESASFRVGLQSQTPRQAAELCGMHHIRQITPDGGICAINKWGHEIVILDVPGRGPIAVDVTFEYFVNEIGKRPRYQRVN